MDTMSQPAATWPEDEPNGLMIHVLGIRSDDQDWMNVLRITKFLWMSMTHFRWKIEESADMSLGSLVVPAS